MPVDFKAKVLAPVARAFGGLVYYTPQGGEPVPIEGAVFSEPHEVVENANGAPFSVGLPAVGFYEADLPEGADQGDTIVINGRTYRVIDIQPDGEGWVELPLEKV